MTETPTSAPSIEAITPPHSVEAERAVLGALLIEPAAINEVIGLGLSPDDFYRQSHARVFRAILGLYEKGDRPDLITLVEELTKSGDLESVGGQTELSRLFEYAVTAANLEHHSRIVLDKAAVAPPDLRLATDLA